MKLRNQYFILRHGRTIYQGKKRNFIYPWPENPPVRLTREGEKQIRKSAKKLEKEKIDLIYSSDTFRAVQTAKIVAERLKLEVIFDKRLRDINLGVYHGERKEKFYRDFPDPKKRFSQKPRGGESWLEAQKRMLSFLKEIDKKYKNKTILIVSHCDPLWLLEGALKKLSRAVLLKQKFERKGCIKTGELRKL